MITLFTSNFTHAMRPAPGVAVARMFHGIEWEMLSRSPEWRRNGRRM